MARQAVLAGLCVVLLVTAYAMAQGQEAEDMGGVEVTVQTVDLRLVGVQGIIPHDRDFMAELTALREKLGARLGEIENVSDPPRAIGYWHFIDNATRLHFVGVQVDTLEGFEWDYEYGLVAWAPGLTEFAVAREKNGEEGTTVPAIHARLGALGYDYDSRFIGDFEVFPLDWIRSGNRPAGASHEIWLPVVPDAPAAP